MTQTASPSTPAPLPMLEKRRIEAQILKCVFDVLVERHGRTEAEAVIGEAVSNSAIAQGKEFRAKEDHEPDKAAATYRRLLEMLEGQVRPPPRARISSAVGAEPVCWAQSPEVALCDAGSDALLFLGAPPLLAQLLCATASELAGRRCGSGVPHGARALRRRGAALQGAAGPRRRAGQGARQGPAVRTPPHLLLLENPFCVSIGRVDRVVVGRRDIHSRDDVEHSMSLSRHM